MSRSLTEFISILLSLQSTNDNTRFQALEKYESISDIQKFQSLIKILFNANNDQDNQSKIILTASMHVKLLMNNNKKLQEMAAKDDMLSYYVQCINQMSEEIAGL